MIYGENRLANGFVGGDISALPHSVTRHDPSLVTQVLARHHGNIVNIAHTFFQPHEFRADHVNADVDELLIAVQGVIDVTSGDDTVTLDAGLGGYVFIPHGVTQAEKNNGNEQAALLSIAIRNELFVHLNQIITE